jgi:hypothetical protein
MRRRVGEVGGGHGVSARRSVREVGGRHGASARRSSITGIRTLGLERCIVAAVAIDRRRGEGALRLGILDRSWKGNAHAINLVKFQRNTLVGYALRGAIPITYW